jgi:hypothetical protein
MNLKTLSFALIFSLAASPALVAQSQPALVEDKKAHSTWETIKEYALPIAAVAGVSVLVLLMRSNNQVATKNKMKKNPAPETKKIQGTLRYNDFDLDYEVVPLDIAKNGEKLRALAKHEILSNQGVAGRPEGDAYADFRKHLSHMLTRQDYHSRIYFPVRWEQSGTGEIHVNHFVNPKQNDADHRRYHVIIPQNYGAQGAEDLESLKFILELAVPPIKPDHQVFQDLVRIAKVN